MSFDDTLRDLVTLRWRGAATRRQTRRLGFFVVGVQKGGTTTLDRLLRLHPAIELPSRRKELHYFDDDRRFDGTAPRDGYARLQREFYFDRPLAGEITPSYLYWHPALERIRAYNPAARIVVLLRNPTLRAWSHWGHLSRKKSDGAIDSFADRLRREAKAVARDPGHQDLGLSHIGRSLYAPQIRRLEGIFPAGQVLFLKSEAFFADQQGVTDAACRFLGVAPLTSVATPPSVHANAGAGQRMPAADWTTAYPYFAEDIDAVERLLGWDCSDWRAPPR
ncbi:MAG: sulfotransferase [Rhizobiales bacterium]|nr:sulfotransferase [Hyphomicrobiales bacterium]